MKALYKVIIFFSIFHITVLMINSFGLFPGETLYSDATMSPYDIDSPAGFVAYIFPAINGEDVVFSLIVAGFTSLGVLLGLGVSIATHSLAPITISIIGATMIPMMLTSWNFFSKLLYHWDSDQLGYLALALGVGLIVIAMITILEMATHGRSGT